MQQIMQFYFFGVHDTNKHEVNISITITSKIPWEKFSYDEEKYLLSQVHWNKQCDYWRNAPARHGSLYASCKESHTTESKV